MSKFKRKILIKIKHLFNIFKKYFVKFLRIYNKCCIIIILGFFYSIYIIINFLFPLKVRQLTFIEFKKLISKKIISSDLFFKFKYFIKKFEKLKSLFIKELKRKKLILLIFAFLFFKIKKFIIQISRIIISIFFGFKDLFLALFYAIQSKIKILFETLRYLIKQLKILYFDYKIFSLTFSQILMLLLSFIVIYIQRFIQNKFTQFWKFCVDEFEELKYVYENEIALIKYKYSKATTLLELLFIFIEHILIPIIIIIVTAYIIGIIQQILIEAIYKLFGYEYLGKFPLIK